MPFRLFNYLLRFAPIPFLVVIVLPAFIRENETIDWLSKLAFLILFPYLLLMGVFAFAISLRRVKMNCPFCGRAGLVQFGSKGYEMSLECLKCGRVHAKGFVPVRFEIEKVEPDEVDELD